MSSSEDEDVFALAQVINLNRKRKYWVHPYLLKNCPERGSFRATRELRKFPDKFQKFYGMSKETFHLLLQNTKDSLQKKETNWRKPICPAERLLITLRYFLRGSSLRNLSEYFIRGESTVRNIVHETSKILWQTLQPTFMPRPDTHKWKNVTQRFHTLWNLPNCIGSIDGKHIRVQAPPNSGSAYYNYKEFFSIVLLAVVDADGLFLTVDVGEYGRNSDGRAFKESNLFKSLTDGSLQLPEDAPLPGEYQSFPHYFIGDQAFPLMRNLMTPFSRAQLNNNKRQFNLRLSRPRKIVECCFGMLTSKFRLLRSPISCHPSKVDDMVLAMCVLHNFLRICEGTMCQPRIINTQSTDISEMPILRYTAKNLRDHLCEYVCHRAPIELQNMYCV